MATDKHQRFQQQQQQQQQFGRGPSVVVAAGIPQSPLVVAVQAAVAAAKQQPTSIGHSASIAIQVPSTSNEQLHRDTTTRTSGQTLDANNNVNSAVLRADRPANRPKTTATSTLNHCHHEAATRTLLFHHQHQHHHPHRLLLDSSHTTDSSLRADISIHDTLAAGTHDADEAAPTPPPNYHEIPGIVPAYQGRSSGPPPSYDDVVNPNAPPPSYQSLFGQVREARKTSNGLVDLLRQLFLILIGTLGCTMIIGFLLLIPITMILVGILYVNECKAENIPTFLVIGGIVWIMKNILNCYNQFKKDSSSLNRPPPRPTPILSGRTTYTTSAAGGGDSPASVLIVGSHQQPDINNNQVPATTTRVTTSSRTTTRTRRELADQTSANRIRTPSLIGITSFKCESMLNYFLIVWFFAGCIVVYRIYEPDYDNPLSQSYCHRTVYLYAFWLITSAFIIMAIVLSCLCCLMASSLMNCNHGR